MFRACVSVLLLWAYVVNAAFMPREGPSIDTDDEDKPWTRSAALKSFFCWTVQGPGDNTVPLTLVQMRKCGGFAVFSNYSNEENHTYKIYPGNMQVGLTPGGWANNTDLFLQAWHYIAASSWPDSFQWFVKVDADTFLRPRFLPQAVATLNSNDAIAITVEGRLRGALEVMSYRAFRHPNSASLYDRKTKADRDPYLGGEDVWIGYAFKKAGFSLAEAKKMDGCVSFLLSYFNLPVRFRDLPGTVGGTRNVPPQIMSYLGDDTKEELKGRGGGERCVHEEILAIHPVKDLDVYAEYLAIDAKLERKAARKF